MVSRNPFFSKGSNPKNEWVMKSPMAVLQPAYLCDCATQSVAMTLIYVSFASPSFRVDEFAKCDDGIVRANYKYRKCGSSSLVNSLLDVETA